MELSQIEINSRIITKALTLLGVEEVAGKKNNQDIVDMFEALGFEHFDDEIPWCAAFVGYVLKECKLDYLKSLRARDYSGYGVPTNEPIAGTVVTLWRESYLGTKGHCGFYLHHDEEYIWILGGNQSNQVKMSRYPIDRLLSLRDAVLPA